MATNKLFCLYIMLIVCLFAPLALLINSYSTESPTTVVEVFRDKTYVVAFEPEATNTGVSLVPLRSMLEPGREIERALRYKEDYERRCDNE